MIAVFTTSELIGHQDRKKSLVVKATIEEDSETIEICSKGRLEEALDEGFEVFVVSTRNRLGPHDEWWVSLVKKENVFLVDGDDANRDDEQHAEAMREPWQKLYKRLGFHYPNKSVGDEMHPVSCIRARYELADTHGVKLGYRFGD